MWEHYEFVLSRVGPIPTLIEWDSNLPEWPILKAEAAAAQTILIGVPVDSLMPLKSSQHELGPLRYAAAFSSALTRPDLETPSLVIGPNGKRGTKRYNVYRNDVTVSLIDALAAVFPAVQRITGVEFFRAMARSYMRETPPRSPLLFEYGHDFPLFVERYEYASQMPWLGDVARLERAWLDAYHAADANSLSADDLADAPSEQLADLRLLPHPATRIIRSRFAAVTIFAANRTGSPLARLTRPSPRTR